MTTTAVESFITADDQLHHMAVQISESFRIAWDETTRTYTAGGHAALVTTNIDDATSVETGWEWTLLTSGVPQSTRHCSVAELDLIRSSIIEHLNH